MTACRNSSSRYLVHFDPATYNGQEGASSLHNRTLARLPPASGIAQATPCREAENHKGVK